MHWCYGTQPWWAFVVTIAVVVTLSEAFFDIPGAMGYLVVIPLTALVAIAEDRLYHAWWAWRHPVRCQGGGHAEPESSPT